MTKDLISQRFVPVGSLKVADKLSDAVVYLREYATAKGTAFVVLAFHGKAAKPTFHYRYSSAAQRETKVREHFGWRRSHAERIERERREQAEKRAKGHGLQVGHILRSSWGYDQTNIDYYQVVELVGTCSVRVCKIGSIMTEATGWAMGKCVPNPDSKMGDPMLRRVGRGGGVRISSCQWASLWDGKQDNWTAYA